MLWDAHALAKSILELAGIVGKLKTKHVRSHGKLWPPKDWTIQDHPLQYIPLITGSHEVLHLQGMSWLPGLVVVHPNLWPGNDRRSLEKMRKLFWSKKSA